MKIKIIGLGGIGSILSNMIGRYCNSKCEKENADIEITLIDGDEYEGKNFERQEFLEYGNKAESKYKELLDKFCYLKFNYLNEYINEENVGKIIQNEDIIFIGVDNHKSRKIISEFVENLNDVILISGGNELTDGNVQIFIKKGGSNVTPALTDYHPEIQNPVDKLPSEMSCEELSKSEPQLIFTNFMIACYMCAAFYNIFESNKPFVVSEVYVDLITMNASSKIRKPKKGENND